MPAINDTYFALGRSRVGLVVSAAALLLAAPLRTAWGQTAQPQGKTSTPPCYSADGTSALLLHSLQTIVSGTDSIAAKERGYAALPQGAASSVSFVTNKTTCAKLLSAYQAQAGYASGTVKQVYGFQVGPVYVVVDPKTKAGEWSLALTFDSRVSKVLARVFQ